MDELLDYGEELKASGWYLSEEGLASCTEQCKEKGWKVTTNNLKKIALDADLRSIGGSALSDDVSRNLINEVSGPIVLQIQKLKNVAVPSAQQNNPSPSKRLLRLQLTDGHVHVPAVEFEVPINNLSPVTPPGTKVKLVGKVAVHNGFLLLKKPSLEVLGGKVDVLLKKWNSQRMTAGNVERSKAGMATGPPPFTPFKTSVTASGSKTGADKTTTAEAHASHIKKPSASGYLTKGTELSKKQQPYYYESSKPSSRDSWRPQERARGKTEDKGIGKGEEKMKSEPTGKTNLKQREPWREDGGINSKRSSMNQANSGQSKEKDGEREFRYQTKSSGKRTDFKDGSGFSDGSSREFHEPQRGGYSHRDRGRRGRGRGTDLDNHRTSSLREFDSEPHRTKEPHYEGGRRGRGRGRGRGKGRRGRRYNDDDDDDGDYQPLSRPTTGLSLGDYFDQKLVLSDRRDSSHFGWYEEDYEWEQPHDGMEEYRASYYADQREARHTDKTRAKEAWAEEEYPPMPSAKVPSASGPRLSPSPPPPPPPPPQEQPMGESHWDWVSGSGAPSSARKQ